MKKININDLPKYSPWVKRLVGLEVFKKVVRSEAKNYEEYNNDKFKAYVEYSKQYPDANFNDIRILEKRGKNKGLVCISKKSNLFLTTAESALQMERDLLIKTLKPLINRSDVVIDLGASYGYNLFLLSKIFPNNAYIGGDFSPNAIILSKRLLKNNRKVSIVPFNFYDREWDIFQSLKYNKILVFTYHSIMQLPKASSVFRGLQKYKEYISDVIHLEPIYEMYSEADTLGLLRKKYTLLNHYNTDLLTVLEKAKSEVDIIDTKYDVLGMNPLLPTSIIHWRFKKHKRK